MNLTFTHFYFQDGTIGDDLVVKPLSAATRRLLSRPSPQDQVPSPSEPRPSYPRDRSLLAEYVRQRQSRNDFRYRKSRTDIDDDYAFLDEDEDLEDEDVMVGNGNSVHARWNGRMKREAEEEEDEDDFEDADIRPDLHVIFKRKDATLNHNSDYRELN